MNAAVHDAHSLRKRLHAPALHRADKAFGVLAGLVFTTGLFVTIAHVEKVEPGQVVEEIADLRSVSLPSLPPPPPPTPQPQAEAEAEPLPVAGLEYSPSDSPVKIAASPLELDSKIPPPAYAPPANTIQLPSANSLRPKLDLNFDASHVFQQGDVDKIPTVLYRENPVISSRVRNRADMLRVTLLIIVDTTGATAEVRVLKPSGNAEFDSIVSETVRTRWGFTPAVRKGKRVRCLLQEVVTIRWTSGSPFQASS